MPEPHVTFTCKEYFVLCHFDYTTGAPIYCAALVLMCLHSDKGNKISYLLFSEANSKGTREAQIHR